jgi:hypothetical protein
VHLYKGKNKERISAVMLKSISAPPIPLWKTNIGKASTCHTERRKADTEGRKVVVIDVVAVEEQKL